MSSNAHNYGFLYPTSSPHQHKLIISALKICISLCWLLFRSHTSTRTLCSWKCTVCVAGDSFRLFHCKRKRCVSFSIFAVSVQKRVVHKKKWHGKKARATRKKSFRWNNGRNLGNIINCNCDGCCRGRTVQLPLHKNSHTATITMCTYVWKRGSVFVLHPKIFAF